ncbi:hypothetical protein N7463_006127 [Penicillium fimorum]|uniref:Uncharacterized protein n=1 Tax=Penicillium fimorum TaxID=1882269 RepID=A0A9X0C5S6_9EURO|nr:hypothetical protein N7463_006127 [Penicillium fimorum]
MPPHPSTKRAYSEPPVDPEESGKKRKANTNGKTTAKNGSPSPSSSSDFSSDEAESEIPVVPENYVDYSMLAQARQAGQAETYSRPPRQQRWKHDGDVPITDPALVPEGWNADELDLNFNDIDGQIERCMERISDGILPDFFEFRLSQYEKRRAARDEMIHSEPAGLSWDIVRRLDHMKIIETHLSTNGDPDDQLPNVKAITKAYREGRLGWSRGWVSYWSKGVQLNTPQKFDADYHKKLAEEYDTTRAWWVEGLQAPGGANLGGFHAFPPANGIHSIEWRYVLIVKILTIIVVEIDVRLNDGAGQTLSYWMRIQACVLVNLPAPNAGMLLSGPFLRFALYTATCPDGQGNLYVCNFKRELMNLPTIPPNFVPRAPPFVNTAPPAPNGGPPAPSVLAQTSIMTPMAVQPAPLQPPQPPKKVKARKGKKKGKNAAP